jgi:hypothetical protein
VTAIGTRDGFRGLAVLFFVSALGCALTWNWSTFVLFRFVAGLAIVEVYGPWLSENELDQLELQLSHRSRWKKETNCGPTGRDHVLFWGDNIRLFERIVRMYVGIGEYCGSCGTSARSIDHDLSFACLVHAGIYDSQGQNLALK